MNRLSEHARTRAVLPVDEQRRAIEHRFELARARFLHDLDRVSALARRATSRVERRVLRDIVIVGGLLLFGLVGTLVRRRRRRLRIVWR